MAVVDQGAILRSGAALIPDLQAQLAQQQQLDIQRQQANTSSLSLQRQLIQDQREQATADAYAADVANIAKLPREAQPQAIIALMAKYPKQSEALKRQYDSQDEAVKSADFRAAAEVYSFVQNGAPEKAAALIRKRIDADKAAGLDTSDDEDIAVALESGDPAKIQEAAAQIGWQLSTAAGPEKFAATYGAIDKKTEFSRKLDEIAARYGQEAADNYARNTYDPFVESNNKYGTTFYRSSDLARGVPAPQHGQTGGVGEAGGGVSGGKGQPVADAGSIAKGLFPNIEITQQRRDPNSALGKANPKSWHNHSAAAIDVRPIKGMSFSEYVKKYRDAGYTILEAKNEVGAGRSKWATGDHWHVVLGGGPQSGPARISSKAQYDKLAPGTVYIAPDGSRRTKS